jgi:DNA polymerase (family 10)
MAIENAEVARIFREVADLLEIQQANPFRVRAYRNAARIVEECPEPMDELARNGAKKLDALPGVGPDLAGKIQEIVRTGGLSMLGELEGSTPPGAAELMRIPSIGPKRARILAEKLQIQTLESLREAAAAGRIHELPGFGQTTEQKILHELETRAGIETRVLRPVAVQYAESLLKYLRAQKGVKRIEIAGSYRRCRETVGDLDILVSAGRGSGVVEAFVNYPEMEEILAHGPTRAAIRLRSGLQVDLRKVPEIGYGAALHYFTGSKAHNIAIRRMGQRRKLKINEYGVFRGEKRVGGRTEEEVFRAVGLPWIPPELRENRGEIEAAAVGRLPALVTQEEIQGDLHVHTKSSDGRNTLAEMVEAAEALGYVYLAITDHSPAVRIARGMKPAGFRRQWKEIDRLNARAGTLRILKGAEVDILPDGTLDLPDAILDELDVVVASVHSKLDLPQREQTRRIVRALKHRCVDVLGHPTGRLLGRRGPSAFALEDILKAAADHGVLLEVNAQPDRLDLDDVSVRAVTEHGLRLVISTDAHSTAELRFMRWGVEQARRGWAENGTVANTFSLEKLLPLLHGCRHGGGR